MKLAYAALMGSLCTLHAAAQILPDGWDPKLAADKVLARLVTVTAPQIKGAHDAELALVGDRAYIVAEVNEVQANESAEWPYIYAALSVVNLRTLAVEKILPFARSEQVYENETLPAGACFVPRILQKDDHTLRCFFASESPKHRQSQTWMIDFDTGTQTFENRISKARIKTARGVFDLQPRFLYEDAVAQGFSREAKDFGLYIFDSFKTHGGKIYTVLNNYPIGQNALAVLNAQKDTFEVVGHFNEPAELKLTESSVNQLPDGTWLAIVRQEGGNANYVFTTSKDGRHWEPSAFRPLVPTGASSKPTFDFFHGVYYLGWQENSRIAGINRSVFNLEVSKDGLHWERKYRFETEKSFQYPSFREHGGSIYLAVTQGDSSPSRKERIMFGKLE